MKKEHYAFTICACALGVSAQAMANAEPVADIVVEQVTNIGSEATVRLDGNASFDTDDPIESLNFEWTVDTDVVCDGPFADCGTLTMPFTYDTHHVRLRVTDPQGAVGETERRVRVDPAMLALLEIDKLKVEFNYDPPRVKIKGEIGLPFGVDFEEVAPMAFAQIAVGDTVVLPTTPLLMELSGNHKWKYRDSDTEDGVRKADIDWKGARFKYNESGVPVEFKSQLISSTETILTVKYKPQDLDSTLGIDFDGLGSLKIHPDGTISTTLPFEVESEGKEITLTLPFPLLETSTILFTDALTDTIQVADHYRTSVGRFRIESRFDGSLIADGADHQPRTVDLLLSVGAEMYPGAVLLEADDIKVSGDKWKENK